MEACYLAFYGVRDGPGEVLLFIGVNAVTVTLLSVVLWRARKSSQEAQDGRTVAMIVLGMGVMFRFTLVPHGVVGSDDIYRYLWDGKVAASGIDPFLYPPNDPRLAHLASADLPSKVNHPDMRSVYPVAAQLFFLASYWLVGESAAGFKLLLALVDSLTVVILWRTLRARGGGLSPLLIYAWSPLPVLYFGLDGHIDALGIFFLAVSLTFVFTDRMVRGSVALAFSALVKIVPLALVPVFFRLATGMRKAVVLLIPLVITGLGLLLSMASGGGGMEALMTFGSRWAFNGGFFMLVYHLLGSNEAAHIVSAGAMALWIGILALLDRPIGGKMFWGFTGCILLSPVVHPWYLTWVAMLLAFHWSLSAYAFLSLSFLANIVVYRYRAYGVWEDQALILLLEYVPVAVILGWEIATGRFWLPARTTRGGGSTTGK